MKNKLKFYFNKIIFYWEEHLKELILFFIGLLICGFYLFWRMIKERLPHEIEFSWNIYLFLLYFYLFLLLAYLLKQILKPKVSKNKIIIWLKEILFVKIIEIYDKALLTVFKFFYLKFSLAPVVIYISEYLSKILDTPIILGRIFVGLQLLPRIIAVEFFFIDVIIFNEFYYFYKFIWLLLIPFFFNIVVFIIESSYNHMWNIITYYYEIKIKRNKIIKDDVVHRDIEVWFHRKPRTAEQLTEEEWIELKKLIPIHIHVNENILEFLGSKGIFFNNKFYERYKIVTTSLYMLIWGYFALRLLLDNIINNLI